MSPGSDLGVGYGDARLGRLDEAGKSTHDRQVAEVSVHIGVENPTGEHRAGGHGREHDEHATPERVQAGFRQGRIADRADRQESASQSG